MRKNGKLKVGYANDKEAPDYLVKEIGRLEEETYQYEQKEAEETLFKQFASIAMRSTGALTNGSVNYICQSCKEELIPLDVVEHFDFLDGGDPLEPPKFSC